MALFALWRADVTLSRSPDLVHARLAAASHIDPAVTTATMVSTQKGLWHLSAFATRTHFYAPEDQVHLPSGGGVCIIHGLIWRADAVRPRVLHAAEIAEVLNRPDATLPDDIAGEFAIARLLPCGTLLAFSDPAGLHQLFHHDGHRDVVANRASLVATLTDTSRIDAQAGAWITTTGYRVGAATAWRGIRQLAAGHALVDGRTVPLPRRIELPPEPRGYTYGGEALLERGMAQASAAIELSVPEGAIIDLPLTGGKDSRAVLALCLRAGLRERLRTFTRGYVDSPDAIAAALLAKVVGVPHRREPPLGSDQPFDLTLDEFHENFARLAFQTDGGMGGWDMITGRTTGTDTLLTGHMGEVLKAYSKRALPTELDPVALVRLQSPFDPLGILRAEARTRMVEQLAAAMTADRQGGAWEADLPDLFYLHNRIPNWLGGIRGIKSFERQPVLPLGVPALMELAFRMTPDERRAELAHYSIISAAAPELLALPFAHQKWDASLPDAPQIDPVLVPAGKPLFGNWQYSLNTRPEIRAHLSKLFSSTDLELWDWIDRDAVIERLLHQQIDYFSGISLLVLTVSSYHSAGLLFTERLAAPEALTYGEAHSPPPPFRDGTMEVMW